MPESASEIAALDRQIEAAKRRGYPMPAYILEEVKEARAKLKKGQVKLALLRALV